MVSSMPSSSRVILRPVNEHKLQKKEKSIILLASISKTQRSGSGRSQRTAKTEISKPKLMRNQKKPSVFFLGPGGIATSKLHPGGIATSTLHRCLMVSRELETRGYECKCFSVPPHVFSRVPDLLSYVDCWRTIVREYPNFLVLHRNSNFVDFYAIKRIKKSHPGIRIIFDYDDALFHVPLPGRIAAYSHLNQILSMSDGVTAGSHYLKEFARKLNKNVTLLPSPVDMELFNPSVRRTSNSSTTIIGWLGGGVRGQLPYLKILKDPLNALAQKYDIKLRIVSALSKAVRAEFTNQRFDVDFGLDHWAPIEEIPELISDFDIAVMPLIDDKWSRGKCAMKLLEYMSMKLATVSSAVGENRYAIDHGRNGFLASSPQEWTNHIGRLIVDPDLRKELGENGYQTVKERYSLQAVVDTLEQVIKKTYDTEPT
jgi:glycosyltransferase involved in cell wall biosynthesis